MIPTHTVRSACCIGRQHLAVSANAAQPDHIARHNASGIANLQILRHQADAGAQLPPMLRVLGGDGSLGSLAPRTDRLIEALLQPQLDGLYDSIEAALRDAITRLEVLEPEA